MASRKRAPAAAPVAAAGVDSDSPPPSPNSPLKSRLKGQFGGGLQPVGLTRKVEMEEPEDLKGVPTPSQLVEMQRTSVMKHFREGKLDAEDEKLWEDDWDDDDADDEFVVQLREELSKTAGGSS